MAIDGVGRSGTGMVWSVVTLVDLVVVVVGRKEGPTSVLWSLTCTHSPRCLSSTSFIAVTLSSVFAFLLLLPSYFSIPFGCSHSSSDYPEQTPYRINPILL